MKTIKLLTITVIAILGSFKSYAQKEDLGKPTIILVHGVWADGSSWSKQISALQAKGYPVIAVQNPVTSLVADVEVTKRAIGRAKGDVILVGHSWGGFVITNAGNDPKVKALVYVAAFAPDLGETITSLGEKGPAITVGQYLDNRDGFLFLSREGVGTVFAQDLPSAEQDLIYATQTPGHEGVFAVQSEVTAWKTRPSWFIQANSDKAITPQVQSFMAKRAKSKITEIDASHVPMLSQPDLVTRIIEEAATSIK